MALSKRQKAYRDYLKTEHWKALRAEALKRDEKKCQGCGSARILQVHHKLYRGCPEDTQLSDLITLCKKCHRKEHGLGASTFESKWREIELEFRYQRRPQISQWRALRALIATNDDVLEFGELMYQYVVELLANERDVREWWMIPERRAFWHHKAHLVKQSIQGRTVTNVRPTI